MDPDTLQFGGPGPSRRTRLLVLVFAALGVAIAGFVVVMPRGETVRRPLPSFSPSVYSQGHGRLLRASETFSATQNGASRIATFSFRVSNTSGYALTISKVGRSGEGLVLRRIHPPLPTVVAPHAATRFALVYRVRRCTTLLARNWPVPLVVRVAGKSAKRTLMIAPPSTMASEPWQRALVGNLCPRLHP